MPPPTDPNDDSVRTAKTATAETPPPTSPTPPRGDKPGAPSPACCCYVPPSPSGTGTAAAATSPSSSIAEELPWGLDVETLGREIAGGGSSGSGSATSTSALVNSRAVVDDFRWFRFNQPIRGDHFGITELLLDTYYRERAARRLKEIEKRVESKIGGPSHEEWLEYVRRNPDVGLFTIAYMHDGPRPFVKLYVKLLLYLILGAQLLIPFIFWLYRASFWEIMNTDELCPATATVGDRALSLAVAFIYFAKINFLIMEKLARGGKSQVLNETNGGGKLQIHVALDRYMDLVYRPLVYIINLKIIFIEDNSVEIILNALAMEFILLLDQEMKDLYLRVFEPDVLAYRIANNEFGRGQIPCWQFYVVVLFSYYTWAALWLCLVTLVLTLIYLPMCKV